MYVPHPKYLCAGPNYNHVPNYCHRWSSYHLGANHWFQVAVPGGQSRGSGEQLVCYGLASTDGDQDYHDDEEVDGNEGTEYSVFVDNEANNNNNIMITTMKSWWNKYYYLLLFW